MSTLEHEYAAAVAQSVNAGDDDLIVGSRRWADNHGATRLVSTFGARDPRGACQLASYRWR